MSTTSTRKSASPAIATVDHAIGLLKAQFHRLSAQLQKAAQHLIDHADDVPVLSMRAMAAEAGVHPTAMVRLVRQLGFDGWPAFRALFVARLRSQSAPYSQRARSVVTTESADALIAANFEAQTRNLRVAENRNHEALKRVAAVLEECTHVHVAGFRASYPLAFLFQYLYRFFRTTVTLASGPGGTTEMLLRAIQRGDAVVVVSFAPYSREARLVADYAGKKGASVVAVTDSLAAPIARCSDVPLVVPVDSPSFFPSVIAGFGIVESLIELLLSRAGKEAVRRVETAERELMELSAYEHPAPARRKRGHGKAG